MKSPFTGMDPFIEGSPNWGDFHQSLISQLKRALVKAVPDRYAVRSDYRLVIQMVEPESKGEHAFLPDVSVRTRGGAKRAKGAGAATAAAPYRLRGRVEEEVRESFIEILDTVHGNRLVTSVEVLSPSDKGASRGEYLRKRQATLLGGVNLVEIDLLRGGERMPMLDPWPDSPYTLLVGRAGAKQRCDVWPAYSAEPLPTIPYPLGSPRPGCTARAPAAPRRDLSGVQVTRRSRLHAPPIASTVRCREGPAARAGEAATEMNGGPRRRRLPRGRQGQRGRVESPRGVNTQGESP